jgi:hypothetical protein
MCYIEKKQDHFETFINLLLHLVIARMIIENIDPKTVHTGL